MPCTYSIIQLAWTEVTYGNGLGDSLLSLWPKPNILITDLITSKEWLLFYVNQLLFLAFESEAIPLHEDRKTSQKDS